MNQPTRPLASVITQAVSELANLVQTEIRLARAEMAEKLGDAAKGGTLIAAALVLLLGGLLVLLLGAVRWLAIAGLPEQWGFILVGAAAVGIGVALALKGKNNLTASTLMPEKIVEQMRADLSIAKEHANDFVRR